MRLNKGFLLIALITGGFCAASAQETPAPNQLTQDLVSARIQALRGQEAQEGNESILQSYEQIANWLAEAEVHGANEKAFLQALNDAPAQESEIRKRIENTDYRAAEIDPASVSKLDSEEIQSSLTALRVRLRDESAEKDTINNRISSEQSNATNVQARFEAIDKRLQELPADAVNIEPTLAPSQFEAEQWSALAERTALVSLRRSLEARLSSQPVRYSLYAAQSTESKLRVDALNFAIETLEAELAKKDEAQETHTTISLDENAPGYGLVQRLLAENVRLQTLKSDRSLVLEKLKDRDELLKQTQQELQSQFGAVQQIVSLAESSSSLGHVLMSHWHQADEFRLHDAALDVPGDIGDAVIYRARVQEELQKLGNADEFVNEELADEYGEQPPEFDDAMLATAIDQVRSRRQLLRELVASATEAINLRGSITRGDEQLDQTFDEYKAYLRSRILWVPSHPPLSFSSLKGINKQFKDLIRNFSELRLTRLSALSIALLLFALAVILLRKKMYKRVQSLSQKIGRARDDSIGFSFEVAILTLIRSIAPSLVVLFLAFSLLESYTGAGVAPYLAKGLFISAKTLFLLMLLRVSCEEKGLAEAHFGWMRPTCDRVRRVANGLLLWMWPIGLCAAFAFRLEADSLNATFGRLFFVLGLIMLGVLLPRFLRPGRDAAQENKGFRLWGSMAVRLLALLFVIGILRGYLYTAEELYGLVINSLLMGVGLLYFYFFMHRWLLVARRKLRFQELINARQAADDHKGLADDDQAQNLVTLSESVGQLLKTATLAIGAIGLVVIWAPLLHGLEAMQRVTLWTINDMSEGESVLTSITLASVVLAVFIAVVAIYAARTIPRLMDLVLRSRKNITPGSRYATVKLLQYVIVTAGVLIFLSTLGLRWDRLQWLVAALGVGIGFGLQEIIANFISGLIILFERPIRRGDVVTVGESSGQVIRITIRATLIRDFDGKELLVPNKEFVTGRLLNWTLSDNCIRATINVGIAYGSDVRKAVAIMEDILANHELVLDQPEPDVLFREFGESSLNLAARCFLSDIDQRWFLVSDLHMKIDDAFREAGIVIAFPQIDVHVDPESRGLKESGEPLPGSA